MFLLRRFFSYLFYLEKVCSWGCCLEATLEGDICLEELSALLMLVLWRSRCRSSSCCDVVLVWLRFRRRFSSRVTGAIAAAADDATMTAVGLMPGPKHQIKNNKFRWTKSTFQISVYSFAAPSFFLSYCYQGQVIKCNRIKCQIEKKTLSNFQPVKT